MAFPVVVFNASTGSDSAASGAGPATALTGTSASYSGSVVTLDGSPDLSGVTVDTAVLYLVTSTGRKFFRITAVDNGADTVTVEDAPAGTASGLTWAIGGKRATWGETNSRLLFSADVKPGWTIETETDQTLSTASLTCGIAGNATDGGIHVRGATGAVRVINQTSNVANFTLSVGYWKYSNLKLTNSNGTKTSAHGFNIGAAAGCVWAEDCILGDGTNRLQSGINGNNGTHTLIRCVVQETASHGLSSNIFNLFDCLICNAQSSSHGILLGTNGTINTMQNCIVRDNSGAGLSIPSSGVLRFIQGNVFHGNGGDGIDMDAAANPPLTQFGMIMNNVFTENGGYGISAHANVNLTRMMADHNAFRNNTSGSLLNLTAGANDVTLTADPYTDEASNDFSLNDTAGGGAALKAVGWPSAVRDVDNFVDIGAYQAEPPASGGLTMINSRRNTMIGR